MKKEFKLYTSKERPDLVEIGDDITVANWPEFMMHDDIANQYFGKLYETFPDFQYWLVDELDGKEVIVGIGNSVSLYFDGELENLPEKGWDWALEKGYIDKDKGLKPNLQCALSITMNPLYKGKGISSEMVKAMKKLGEKAELKSLILPVRPSGKHLYPLISIENYLEKWIREEDSYSIDPWIRVHQKLGGKIIKPCNEAMLIEGTVSEWQEWTGMVFHENGDYIIPDALTVVNFDIEKDLGAYIEPNVWMVHELGN